MADAADYATDYQIRQLDQQLAAQRALSAATAVTTPECEDCGLDIPQARRQAAPHVTTCIDCQSIREHKAKGVRR